MPALVGGLVVVLAAVLITLVLPASAGHTAPDPHTGSPGSFVTESRTAAPQQALHTVTTTAAGTALRPAGPGGCPPVAVQPITAPRPTDPPGTPAGVAAVSSCLPLRILLCTWLN
jgi:hypothetical protein